MSQSDIIRFNRTSTILNTKNGPLPPVLNPSDYTSFETYNLETTVANTKNSYSRLVPTTNTYFFDIEKKVSTCPTITMCVNTNTRSNRVLNTAEKIIINGTQIPYTPEPTYRPSKVFIPTTCSMTSKSGYVTRRVSCDKSVCKCKTTVVTN